MKNICKVESDEVCTYVSIEGKKNQSGKYLMGISSILVLLSLISLFFIIDDAILSYLILGSIVLMIAVTVSLARYTLWHMYGRELLIINTKTFKFQTDYKFFQGKPVIVDFKYLKVNFKEIKSFHDSSKGKLIFTSYDERDLPKVIHETSILVSEEDADLIMGELVELFNKKKLKKYNLPMLSLN